MLARLRLYRQRRRRVRRLRDFRLSAEEAARESVEDESWPEGLHPEWRNEIARRLYHTLASIENYVTTFARIAFLVSKGYADEEIAFVIRRSPMLVAAYRQLLSEFQGRRTARQRLQEILGRADKNPDVSAANTAAKAKKGGRRS